MADPLGSVYKGTEGSGAAQILQPHYTGGMQNYINALQQGSNVKTNQLDAQLNQLNTQMGRAWQIDFPELQDDYMKLEEQLRTYESTKNKDERRNQWYGIQRSIGEMRQKISHSQKTEREYLKKYNEIENDKDFLFPDNADEELYKYTQYKVSDRPTSLDIRKAGTIDAIQALVKNTKYRPKETDVTQGYASNGNFVTTQKKVVEVDEQDLKASIEAALPHLKQNEKNALSRVTRKAFFEQNQHLALLPDDQQAAMFKDHVINEAYKILENSYRAVNKDVNIVRPISKSKYSKGSGSLEANGVVMTMDKADTGGNYTINFATTTAGGAPKTQPMHYFNVSGETLLKINPKARFGTEKVDPNKTYQIQGSLSHLKVNPEKNNELVVGIRYRDVVTDIMKQGDVYEIPVTGNTAILKSYVADWYEDIYIPQKQRADSDYNVRMGRKRSPGVGAPAPDRPGDSPATKFKGGTKFMFK